MLTFFLKLNIGVKMKISSRFFASLLTLSVNTLAFGSTQFKINQNLQGFEVKKTTSTHEVTFDGNSKISYDDGLAIFYRPATGGGLSCSEFGVNFPCGSNFKPVRDISFDSLEELSQYAVNTLCSSAVPNLVKEVIGKFTKRTVIETNVTQPVSSVYVCYDGPDLPVGACEQFSCQTTVPVSVPDLT
jgi:hypothetical protein